LVTINSSLKNKSTTAGVLRRGKIREVKNRLIAKEIKSKEVAKGERAVKREVHKDT
jgi:hypothetical protein